MYCTVESVLASAAIDHDQEVCVNTCSPCLLRTHQDLVLVSQACCQQVAHGSSLSRAICLKELLQLCLGALLCGGKVTQ